MDPKVSLAAGPQDAGHEDVSQAVRRLSLLRMMFVLVVAVIGIQMLMFLVSNPRFEWPIVAKYFFDPSILKGLGTTLLLTLVAMVIGIVLGTRRLAARIGEVRARRLVTEGGELDSAQAREWGLADATDETALPDPAVGFATAAAIRAATRVGEAAARDFDLAALVRSAAEPGLRARMAAYVATLRPAAT